MKMYIRLPCAAAILSLAVQLPVASAAPLGGGGLVYTVILPAGEFGSSNFTAVLVQGFAAMKQFCGALDANYRIDCLAERMGELASDIPDDTDYDEVQEALKSASDRMAKLARSNRDRNLPRGKAKIPGTEGETTSRALNPVAQSALPNANKQAEAILAETQTLLLRSSDTADGKKAQYQRIADAIGSNKVLLRSA